MWQVLFIHLHAASGYDNQAFLSTLCTFESRTRKIHPLHSAEADYRHVAMVCYLVTWIAYLGVPSLYLGWHNYK